MIDVKGYAEGKKILQNLGTNVKITFMEVLHKVADDTIDDARAILAQNGNIDTGGLLGSIKIFEEGDNYIIIGTDAPHAGHIEYGRGPVEAAPGKVLRWFDKDTGKMVFARHVKATEPMPFLAPAAERNVRLLKGLFAERIESLKRE